VPEAGAVLVAGEADDLAEEHFLEMGAAGIVFGERVEEGGLREGDPAVAAAPVGDAIRVLVVIKDVVVETGEAVVDVPIECFDLLDGEVEVRFVAGRLAHAGEEGDAHVKIVCPEGHLTRTVAGQGAIGEADLFVLYVIAYPLEIVHVGGVLIKSVDLEQAGCHGTAVVERTDLQHGTIFNAGGAGVELLFEIVEIGEDKVVILAGIIRVFRVFEYGGRLHHSDRQDTVDVLPFVELAFGLDVGGRGEPFCGGVGFVCFGVNEAEGSGLEDVVGDTADERGRIGVGGLGGGAVLKKQGTTQWQEEKGKPSVVSVHSSLF